MKRSSEEAAFDIELSSNESFDEAQLPIAALDSTDIDRLLSQTDALPRTLNCRPLDNRSYAVRLPGSEEEVRVTTDGEVFSYCSDSQLLFSYGSQLFEAVLDQAAAQSNEDSRTGACWIVNDAGKPQFLLSTNTGLKNIQTFRELEAALLDASSPRELPSSFHVIERVV